MTMKELKASEVIEAIKNDAFVLDLDNNNDAILLIQDISNPYEVLVKGFVYGDDKRLSALIADRIIKSENFSKIIHDALTMALEYHRRKLEKCNKKSKQD